MKQNKAPHISMLLVSNITLQPFISIYLKEIFLKSDIDLQVVVISENELIEHCNVRYDYSVLVLNFEELFPDIKFLKDIALKEQEKNILENVLYYYDVVKKITKNSVFWIGFEKYFSYENKFFGFNNKYNIIDYLNKSILENIRVNDVFIDLENIIAYYGYDNIVCKTNKFRWNMPYNELLIKVLSNEIFKEFNIFNNNSKKCLVLDCDNVLWGNVLAEVGIENVGLNDRGKTAIYREFQKYILGLYNQGVILAIASKNDLVDIINVLNNHSDMILHEKHFSVIEANWNNKFDSLKRIADELNIDLSSIVFVDDSLHEIELINNTLPEVSTVLFTNDISKVFDGFSGFNLNPYYDYDSVKIRNTTYRTNKYRNVLKSQSKTTGQFIKSLNMIIDIHIPKDLEIIRLFELVSRTNKFSNGKRYSIDELKELKKSKKYILLTVYVQDRYSNLGLVGAIGIIDNTLDLFSLSCRAMGRNIEKYMINMIEKYNISQSYFKNTGKNEGLKSLLKKYNIRINEEK